MNNEMKIQICRDDFYLMMRNAVIQAGGRDDVDKWKKMRLEEVVNVLAQNGVRMVYMPDRHMDSLKVAWEAPTKEVITNSGPPLGKELQRKQLLRDQKLWKAVDVEEDHRSEFGNG